MHLKIERKPPLDDVDEKQLPAIIASLCSHGPSSHVSLTDEQGNYLQAAGGSATCMLEKRDVVSGRHFRGYKGEKSNAFPDGTALVFGGGEIRLRADEWFMANKVADVFVSFLKGEDLPTSVKWRDMTHVFTDDVI